MRKVPILPDLWPIVRAADRRRTGAMVFIIPCLEGGRRETAGECPPEVASSEAERRFESSKGTVP
jgi:hypothetical protein